MPAHARVAVLFSKVQLDISTSAQQFALNRINPCTYGDVLSVPFCFVPLIVQFIIVIFVDDLELAVLLFKSP